MTATTAAAKNTDANAKDTATPAPTASPKRTIGIQMRATRRCV